MQSSAVVLMDDKWNVWPAVTADCRVQVIFVCAHARAPSVFDEGM